ncbi:DUF5610 domain-containing protein [Alteromonas confluentis]|uniref:DUF5610 domain-containing protein n=1 Tax=Alteromonas confluentis TaxID=1656094 RepID=A0A1E7Z5J6_9ALTE|nr:DUF5610 domain-containing protein [Alteromonas confluentis]OFC68752.1 hypothetical protein BFC18_00495 [Alteromonas confluentis]
MNVGEIKAFVSDKTPPVKEQKPTVSESTGVEDPNKAIQKQLQQEGLRQAAEFQQRNTAMVSVSSSQTTIGLKVYSSSMEQEVSVDGQRGKFARKSDDKGEQKQASLFDFEEVAKNVMKFVGGVIQGAARGGADDDKLNSLFSQAREGVARGIAMAERDLGGMLNDEIATGIGRSRDLISNRIDELESNLLGQTQDPAQLSALESSMEMRSSNSESASLMIRTRDGDEVTLSFESLRQFQYQNQQSYSATVMPGIGDSDEQSISLAAEKTESYAYFDRQGISFSLKGELDDGELTAIADLVGSVNDLADTFFGGDIDKAFEKALELGFDDQELTGYALQLNRVQQTEVVKTYGAIQHYRENDTGAAHGDEARPVAQYLDKMLNVFESATQQLASGEDFNELISGLINEMKEVQVPDLLSAINRFHTFNQRVLEAMPNERERIQPDDRQTIQPAEPLKSGGRETIQPVEPDTKSK